MKNKSAESIIFLNRHIKEKIRDLIISEKNDERRMALIKYYLYFCTNNITGIYSDEVIEEKLIEYGKKILYTQEKKVRKNTGLMVMTTASSVGGHTALVNNWINFDVKREYSIVFTESDINTIPDFIKNTVQSSGGKIFFLQGNDSEKASELLNIAEMYEHIFLHIHMYDVIPIIAFSNKNWKKRIYFYNHANFLFSIGMSISDVVLNICEYDNYRTMKYRGREDSKVLPIPQKIICSQIIENSGNIRELLANKYGFNMDSILILSMGENFKYKKTEKYCFEDFVIDLLEKLPSNTYFYIIGANPKLNNWKKLSKKTQGRAKALGVLERYEVSLWMKIIDIYVVSFPMNAAGSNEAWENGVPCFRFNPISRGVESFSKNESYNTIESMENAIVECINKKIVIEYDPTDVAILQKNAELWTNKLDSIISNNVEHKIHRFKSSPVLENEEVINVQLLSKLREKYRLPLSIYKQLSWGQLLYVILMKIKQKIIIIYYKIFG